MNIRYSIWQKCLSYLWPITVVKTKSEWQPYLEVVFSKGRMMLNTRRANYSFGGLHTVFQIAFKEMALQQIKPSNVLILGFGTGSVASIIQHEYQLTDTKITGVEIDAVVIDLGKNYFATEAYKNTEIINADALEFLKNDSGKYDLIVVDIYDETDVPPKFHESEFIKNLVNHLLDDGYVVYNKVAHTTRYYKEFEKLKLNFDMHFSRVRIIKALGMNRVLIAQR